MDVKKIGRIPDDGGWRAHGRAKGSTSRDRKTRVSFDYVHSVVDDHSRFAYSEVLANEKAVTTAAFFGGALEYFAEHGIEVDAVMTDNAWNCIHGRALRELLTASGTDHITIKPHCPWQDGKVERFNRTLQNEWAYRHVFFTNEDRTAALAPWLENYNTRRRCDGRHRRFRPPGADYHGEDNEVHLDEITPQDYPARITIMGNVVRNAAAAGIALTRECVGVSISGNVVSDCSQLKSVHDRLFEYSSGVYVPGEHCSVSDNVIWNTATPPSMRWGVFISSSDATISDDEQSVQAGPNSFVGRLQALPSHRRLERTAWRASVRHQCSGVHDGPVVVFQRSDALLRRHSYRAQPPGDYDEFGEEPF